MLHIHNGDSTAGTAREFGLPGQHLAFREALVEGPTPDNVSDSEWIEVRARFLSEDYGPKLDEARKDLLEQDNALRRFADHEEVILWFEHDLFCQVNLIYLLDWFSSQSLGKTRLSMICIDGFPGIEDFRGLGQLRGDQLASLIETRHQVTEAELRLGTSAWNAFRSSDPSAVTKLLERDTTPLPYIKDALRLHLMRFPSVSNGLGRVENKALEVVAAGTRDFMKVFSRFADSEARYGFGDSQLWDVLERLGRAKQPLISITGMDSDATKASSFRHASFEITALGTSVLTAQSDFIGLNGIDLWLGGVHLKDGSALWRWDENQRRLVNES